MYYRDILIHVKPICDLFLNRAAENNFCSPVWPRLPSDLLIENIHLTIQDSTLGDLLDYFYRH
jgi:hypothetical protein